MGPENEGTEGGSGRGVERLKKREEEEERKRKENREGWRG